MKHEFCKKEKPDKFALTANAVSVICQVPLDDKQVQLISSAYSIDGVFSG